MFGLSVSALSAIWTMPPLASTYIPPCTGSGRKYANASSTPINPVTSRKSCTTMILATFMTRHMRRLASSAVASPAPRAIGNGLLPKRDLCRATLASEFPLDQLHHLRHLLVRHHVGGVADHRLARVRDGGGELVGVDRRHEAVVGAEDDQGLGADPRQPAAQALVGDRPDELGDAGHRLHDRHRLLHGVVGKVGGIGDPGRRLAGLPQD